MRIIAKRTIEEAMVHLQDAKQIVIANALEGRATKEISTAERTARLFGRVGRDKDGNSISVSDDEDSDTESEVGQDD